MWRQGAKLLLEVRSLRQGIDRVSDSLLRGCSNPSPIVSSRNAFGRGSSAGFAVSSCRGKHWVALWGNGDHGRLGLSSTSTSSRWEPIVCDSLADIEPISVACGGAHTLVLSRDGQVFSTGLNDHGQVGVQLSHATNPPACLEFVEVIEGLPDRCIHIAAGYNHSAAISDEGQVYVWGSNGHGQLGLGKKGPRNVSLPTKIDALKGMKIQKLALGAEHSLAVSNDGEVLSWGNGQGGRLGHGQSSGVLRFFRNTSEFLPRLIDSLKSAQIVDISAGMTHSACVDSYGTVYTFGNGRMFQLGLGTDRSSFEVHEPSALKNLPGGLAVACGGYHTGAVMKQGDLYMWGSNENGCLGFGYKHTDQAPIPMKVDGPFTMQNLVAVSCGWKHTCALTDDGKLFAWGWGGSAGTYAVDGRSSGGQLGVGNEFDHNEPTLVSTKNMTGVKISCGFNHTAAILQDQ
ncbi:hypothetical protein R1flu_019053 [Riccia fluitans]|uniref:RCC1-like domain-containing protein n=1 Tax=Riccia fluitans TaxID=41844 RepID=A0ABD1ZHL1_9MARC